MDTDINIAVIGTGKTGGEVLRLLPGERVTGPFDSSNAPTEEALREADAAVIFVPPGAAGEILETVLASEVPAAWGTTGFEWPGDLDARLRKRGTSWIRASNFSLGMNIIRHCLGVISVGSGVLDEPVFHIHEVHHAQKQDAPSGTALAWKEWLGREAEITSERKGDIKGIHRLTVKTRPETLTLQHEAHERTVFAKGALWAARQLHAGAAEPGFHDFSELFDRIASRRSDPEN
ncbi:MAG: dihydrodipicolinate reductase C-terminal domain-containing protein [Balneolaceae bacterium]|nr:dihydrodipicolinate reductase C-terminal domain-containing protein [Balneolaceae bacterium]